jgi:hypothetical protein
VCQDIGTSLDDLGRDLVCVSSAEIEVVQCKRWAKHKAEKRAGGDNNPATANGDGTSAGAGGGDNNTATPPRRPMGASRTPREAALPSPARALARAG